MKVIMLLPYILLLSLFSCSESADTIETNALPVVEVPQEELSVGFVVVDGVFNSELMAPMDIFQHTKYHTEMGMKVFLVAQSTEPITTFEGLRILPDFTFADCPPIDVLVVPSAKNSMGSDLENESFINFISSRGNEAQYVMSLCDGAFVLAKAGLVDGYESTTFPGDIEKYKEMFPSLAVHQGVSFVHDHKLLTSAGGAKSYDPALYLVEQLYGNKVATGIAKGLVIDWDLREIKHMIVVPQ